MDTYLLKLILFSCVLVTVAFGAALEDVKYSLVQDDDFIEDTIDEEDPHNRVKRARNNDELDPDVSNQPLSLKTCIVLEVL